jgi:hypothetical protein
MKDKGQKHDSAIVVAVGIIYGVIMIKTVKTVVITINIRCKEKSILKK